MNLLLGAAAPAAPPAGPTDQPVTVLDGSDLVSAILTLAVGILFWWQWWYAYRREDDDSPNPE